MNVAELIKNHIMLSREASILNHDIIRHHSLYSREIDKYNLELDKWHIKFKAFAKKAKSPKEIEEYEKEYPMPKHPDFIPEKHSVPKDLRDKQLEIIIKINAIEIQLLDNPQGVLYLCNQSKFSNIDFSGS